MLPSAMNEVDLDELFEKLSERTASWFDEIVDDVKPDIEIGEGTYWFTSTVVKYIKRDFDKTVKRIINKMYGRM